MNGRSFREKEPWQIQVTAAEAGTPLPAEAIIRLMEGQRIKESVLRAIGEGNSAAAAQARIGQQAQSL